MESSESKLLEVQCEVSTASDDLSCQVICCCWSAVFYQVQSQRSVYQETLEHFMLLSAHQLYGDDDLLFQQDLTPGHGAKTTSRV